MTPFVVGTVLIVASLFGAGLACYFFYRAFTTPLNERRPYSSHGQRRVLHVKSSSQQDTSKEAIAKVHDVPRVQHIAPPDRKEPTPMSDSLAHAMRMTKLIRTHGDLSPVQPETYEPPDKVITLTIEDFLESTKMADAFFTSMRT